MIKSTKDIENEFLSEKEKQLAMPKVKMFIPKDKLNPTNYKWICVNGVEYYLAVGKEVEVPQCVADVWNYSYNQTIMAEERIKPDNEIAI